MRALLSPPTVETVEFWQGCREARLLLRSCNRCDHVHYYPRLHCPRCGAQDLGWRAARGDGVIYSYTQVHYSPFGEFWKDEVPYWVVQVDLAEGVRVLSRLRASAEASPRIGDTVALVFEPVDDGMHLPVFRLSPDEEKSR